MDKKQVFISYKSEEFDEANWVRTVLETNGISCWMAPMCITGGSSYATEIPQAIRNCTVFVLILSEQSQSSKWVSREVDRAINENKIIMPFMLENCQLKDDFNFYLTNVQRYAAYESKMSAVEKMVKEIKAILGIREEVKEEPMAESVAEAKAEAPKQEVPKPEEPKQEEPKQEESKQEKSKQEEPKQEAPKEEAPKKEKGKNKKTLPMAKNKKRKGPLPIAAIVSAIILALIIAFSFMNRTEMLTIGGVDWEKDAFSVHLGQATITMEDMEKLQSMEELGILRFTGCSIAPELMKEISKLNLLTLEMSDCQLTNEHIANIDFSKLQELSELILEENDEITELSGVENIAANLTMLNVAGCSITSLDALAGSTEITKLDACRNALTSLKGIENNLHMSVLCVWGNQLTTTEGMENMTVLSEVNLRKNQITDMSVLSKSAGSLRELYVDYNDIRSLEFLSGCTGLENLDADNCGVYSVQPLAELSRLKYLSVANNSLSSLAGLEGKEQLVYLNASNNSIISTEPLKNIKFVDEYGYQGTLNLSNNGLLGIHLSEETDLAVLAVYGNVIASFDVENVGTVHDLYVEYNEGIDFGKLAESDIDYYKIVNCPLDKQVQLKQLLGEYKVEFIADLDADANLSVGAPDAMQDE